MSTHWSGWYLVGFYVVCIFPSTRRVVGRSGYLFDVYFVSLVVLVFVFVRLCVLSFVRLCVLSLRFVFVCGLCVLSSCASL